MTAILAGQNPTAAQINALGRNVLVYVATNFPTVQTDYSVDTAIGSVAVPDPGYPYFVEANGQAEAGAVTTGTRWDLKITVDSVSGTQLGFPAADSAETPRFVQVLPGCSPVLTGAHTINCVLFRNYGGSNGRVTPFNAGMTVKIFPQIS